MGGGELLLHFSAEKTLSCSRQREESHVEAVEAERGEEDWPSVRETRGGETEGTSFTPSAIMRVTSTTGINHRNRGAKPCLLSPRQQMGKALLPVYSVPLIWHNSPSSDEITGKSPNLRLREFKFTRADTLEMSHCWEFGFHLQFR